ncbi:MAG TPA: DNA/RNA nuclease SfsA, partial [Kiloniellales bacterium]
LVGINTALPNGLAEEAIQAEKIAELTGYATLRREVRYGRNSRIDILLEAEDRPPCYVEVKNVHLKRGAEAAEFPDSVTARGAKHLVELTEAAAAGARSVMLFLVQRGDCSRLEIAADIDPEYERTLRLAMARGVEALCYSCRVGRQAIEVDRRLPLTM